MPALNLQLPDWDALVGESREAHWIADRTLKFGFMTADMADILDVYQQLRQQHALFHCSPAILTDIPFAVYWYVCLAGFSLKSLGLATVAAVAGGRAIGQTQNAGGQQPVALLKSRLVEAMATRGWTVEVQPEGTQWMEYRPEHNLAERRHIRFGGRLLCEFIPGRGRPDMTVIRDGVIMVVAEVKGRKDLSNVAESWMPAVNDHMEAWSKAFPDAARLFFGTLITRAIVQGGATSGTSYLGLRALHERGWLTGAYNLGELADNDPAATAQFEDLADELSRLLSA